MHDHPELRLLLAGETASPRREELLRHLQGCATCRAGVAAEDPSRLFALLALEPVPGDLLERLSEGVAESIAEPSAVPAKRSLRRGWASIAASLLLAGSFSTYLLDRDGGGTEPVQPPAVPIVEVRNAEPAFELLSSRETVQVVDLSVGGDRFVMIFDEELDL